MWGGIGISGGFDSTECLEIQHSDSRLAGRGERDHQDWELKNKRIDANSQRSAGMFHRFCCNGTQLAYTPTSPAESSFNPVEGCID